MTVDELVAAIHSFESPCTEAMIATVLQLDAALDESCACLDACKRSLADMTRQRDELAARLTCELSHDGRPR